MRKLFLGLLFGLLLAGRAWGATFVNDGNINWDGNWQTTGDIDVLHASTNLNVDSGSTKYSNYWTGNDSNTDLGCIVYLNSENNAGTITATLQSSTDTAFTSPTDEQTSTFTIDSTTLAATWIFFKLSSSEAEDGSTPLYYRYKFTSDNAADTYFRANNADTSVIGIIQVLAATGTLSADDATYVVGNANGQTGNPATATVTVNINDSSTAYGDIELGSGGVVSYQRTASSTTYLTAGNVTIRAGGQFDIGVSGDAIPSTSTCTYKFANASAAKKFYVADYGKLYTYGDIPTCYVTTLAANITAGDKSLTTTDTTSWAVGDVIVVPTTSSTRTECEKVTITGISGTTIYIDSNGDGSGANPAFAYNHTSSGGCSFVLKLNRNVVFCAAGSVNGAAIQVYSGVTDDIALVATELNALVTTQYVGIIGGYSVKGVFTLSYVSIHDSTGYTEGAIFQSNSEYTLGDIDNLIVYKHNGNAITAVGGMAPQNITNAYAIYNGGGGFYLAGRGDRQAYGRVDYTNLVAIANTGYGVALYCYRNSVFVDGLISYCHNSAWTWSGIVTNVNDGISMKNVKSFYNYNGLIMHGLSMVTDRNSFYGSDGTNTKINGYDLAIAVDSNYDPYGKRYTGINVNLNSTSKFQFTPSTNNNFTVNTFFKFQNYGQVAGRHYTRYKYGDVSDQVTGGQAEAWAYGGSGICAYLNPTSTTAGNTLEWEFYIPVTAATNPALKFYVKKTSSAANCTLNMDVYDSDDDVTKLIDNASITLTDAWAQYSAASISPTNTGYCRVVLKALDGATTGDIGVDDISIVISGTTATDSLNNWIDGLPAPQFDRGGGAGEGGGGASFFTMGN